MLPIDAIGHWWGNDAILGLIGPNLLAVCRIKSFQEAFRRALEDKAACCGEDARVPREFARCHPAGLARHGVPSHQHAGQHSAQTFALTFIIGQSRQTHIDACVPRPRNLLVRTHFIARGGRDQHGWHIDETFLRAHRHRVPIVHAKWGWEHQGRRLGIAGRWVLVRTARLQINRMRPRHRHASWHIGFFRHGEQGIGREKLTRRAIDHIEEAVFGDLHDDFARLAANWQFSQHQMLGRGEIPRIPRRGLIMPDIFARVGLHRHDGGDKQIVALPARADFVVPRRAIADAEIEEV